MKCAHVLPLLPFFACGELERLEGEQVAAHLAACSSCAAQLDEERRLVEAFAALPQPADYLESSDILLSQCRSELAEALDDHAAPLDVPRWQPFAWVRRSLALHPAWSVAALVAFGIAVGIQAPNWIGPGREVQGAGYAVNVRATPQLSEDQLAKMAVAGISFAPSSDPSSNTVQVHLRAEQPMDFSGSLDDADVLRVLTYVVGNGARFDAGVRLDCLEALKLQTGDAGVRRALLAAARQDSNPAVRMKALDALRDSVDEDSVRDVLLDVLDHDTNPGVRVEAINLLVGSAAADDVAPVIDATQPLAPELPDASMERVKRTLQAMVRKDPNPYVRLRSAAALRQLGPRELQ